MRTSKERNILFEQCFTPTLTHTEGDLVFVSKSTWPVSLVAAHKGESLAGPILQVCLCPLYSRLFPMVTGTVTDPEDAAVESQFLSIKTLCNDMSHFEFLA